MIDRYTTKEMTSIWSNENKYNTWLQIELEVLKELESIKTVPSGTYESLKGLKIDIDEINRLEKETRHDVVAFLKHLEAQNEKASYLHRGMTSSDVVDTALSYLITKSIDTIKYDLDGLILHLSQRSTQYENTETIGRTHGIHAKPITFGRVLAGHMYAMMRSSKWLENAKREVSYGKISGAVGTHEFISPEIERAVLSKFSLSPEPIATQVVSRDRHALVMSTLAIVASNVERLALMIRHLQRTEVDEVCEMKDKKQVGSSAMPHKSNPIMSENVTGLARLIRGYVSPSMESIALWHERDISHSSVERVALVDSLTLTHFIVKRMTNVMKTLSVNEEKMKKNATILGDKISSENRLTDMVDSGLSRWESHEKLK